MSEMHFVTEERKRELDGLFEKEIHELKRGILSKEIFVLIIKSKKITFFDFCYLINTYINPVKIIDANQKLPKLDNMDIIAETDDAFYNIKKSTNIPKLKDVKKISRYENMALKGKKVKKRKK